jgi:protoporphyrin/coproporphyrin ferrochelatase
MSKDAVLLIAHGSPEKVEDIPRFLMNVSRGRAMSEAVVREVQHRYGCVGGSPLTRITRQQANGVAHELGVPAYVGMRNWHPFLADTLHKMTREGVEHAVAICLAPHNSRTSVGLYKQALFGNPVPFAIDFVEEWHDHPLLIEAFAERLSAGWSQACADQGAQVPVLFTAHSVPQRTITEGDPYEEQARETAALVAARVPEIGAWRFAFQSQGMSGGEWLGPTVECTITGLRDAGYSGVFIQPIGFVCDHVEILFDIDILFRGFAREQGMKLYRAESLNDSPLFVRALAELARERLRSSSSQCTAGISTEKTS